MLEAAIALGRRLLPPPIALITVLLLLPSPLPAPIVGSCENLDDALRQADTVVVCRVLDTPAGRWRREFGDSELRTMGGYGVYLVYIVRSLQGSLPEHRSAVVGLQFIDTRTLPKEVGEHLLSGTPADSQTTAVLHLAFLTTTPPYMTATGRPTGAGFALNCADSVLPLHPLTQLGAATATHHGIRALFQDSLERYKGTSGEAGAKSLVEWCDRPRMYPGLIPTAAGARP